MVEFRKIPKSPYTSVPQQRPTKYLMDTRTGRMAGREGARVRQRPQYIRKRRDKTRLRLVKKPFVLVRSSRRARGHTRRIKMNEGKTAGRG